MRLLSFTALVFEERAAFHVYRFTCTFVFPWHGRLDGGAAAPVNCLVTNAVYSHSGGQVVIPGGARLLGETKPVQTFGETRLAVAFHRLLLPDGSTYSLDQYPGANQVGDAGLKDQVDNHYWSTFGAAAAIGSA